MFLQIAFILFQRKDFFSMMAIPLTVYGELLLAFLIQIFLYVLLSGFQAILCLGLQDRIQDYQKTKNYSLSKLQNYIWGLSISDLFLSNQYFFYSSQFNWIPLEKNLLCGLLIVINSLMLMLIINAALSFFGQALKHRARTGLLASSMVFIVLLAYALNIWTTPDLSIPSPKQSRPQKPNIILIGIDSLPPNQVSAAQMPTVQKFLDSSIWFKETIAPLARTYPSWISILTGLHPFHHQARYNLIPSEQIKKNLSITWKLKELGYQNLFATDNRLFSPIDESFGFQDVISHKLGVNNFLLGLFNDFPISNLLINCSWGRWLFPYNHLNRSSYYAYYPETFDRKLEAEFSSRKEKNGQFIAIHYTLSHWPYRFAQSKPFKINEALDIQQAKSFYLAALPKIDEEIKSLLDNLSKQGYLESALVVLLSDHGETFLELGSRSTLPSMHQGKNLNLFQDYLKRKTDTPLERSIGHGSDLLSPDQYHCVLAFNIYQDSKPILTHKTIEERVSLMDIAPTIQDFIQETLPTPINFFSAMNPDGISLYPAFKNNHRLSNDRIFFMESDTFPNISINADKLAKIGKDYYTIKTGSNLLELNASKLKDLDEQKLYAIIKGDWIVALYPDDDGYLMVTQNLIDQKWTDSIYSRFYQHAPSLAMLQSAEKFYQNKWLISQKQTEQIKTPALLAKNE